MVPCQIASRREASSNSIVRLPWPPVYDCQSKVLRNNGADSHGVLWPQLVPKRRTRNLSLGKALKCYKFNWLWFHAKPPAPISPPRWGLDCFKPPRSRLLTTRLTRIESIILSNAPPFGYLSVASRADHGAMPCGHAPGIYQLDKPTGHTKGSRDREGAREWQLIRFAFIHISSTRQKAISQVENLVF